jgi:hypothetical protein
MRKLKLNLDDLSVESFHATAGAAQRGTVAANSGPESLFAPERTCAQSCLDPGSCDGTCACSGPACP